MNSLSNLKSKLYSSLARIEFNRSVLFGLVGRIWGGGAGLFTAYLIVRNLSPAYQGYYYTFENLLMLQTFAELGLGTVIVQFASHEWSKLTLDESGEITGDIVALSRLSSLALLSLKWYIGAGMFCVVGLGLGGHLFFSRTPDPTVVWSTPWFVLCLFTGINVGLIPIWSLLEGCNQIASLLFFRLLQGMVVSICCWIALFSGAQLWTSSIACLVTIICSSVFLIYNYRQFLVSLVTTKHNKSSIVWHKELWPMQWRVALTWVSTYFVLSLFTPVLFYFQGATVAGQYGMSWSIIGFMGAVAYSWLAPKIPIFGILVAQRQYHELDAIFRRVTKVIIVVLGLLAFCFWFLLMVFNVYEPVLAKRLLPPLPFGIFLLAQVIVTALMPFSVYLRAHKQEPLLALSILGAVLVGLSNLITAKYFSVTAMAIGYLIIQAVIAVFVIYVWQRCRKIWHA